MPSTGHYPIERREGEIERLRMQAAAIQFDASVMLDRIGVAPGWRCPDLGCGPGGIIELLSIRAGPTGRVIALDADPVLLEQARALARDRGLGNVAFVQGDAYCTGLARGAFEFVHARFVASIVGRPTDLIGEAVALTCPGGIVALQDPDISTLKCYPPHPAWDRLTQVLEQVFACVGRLTSSDRLQLSQPRSQPRLDLMVGEVAYQNAELRELSEPVGAFHQTQFSVASPTTRAKCWILFVTNVSRRDSA